MCCNTDLNHIILISHNFFFGQALRALPKADVIWAPRLLTAKS